MGAASLLLRRLALAAIASTCGVAEHTSSAVESLVEADAVPLHFETKLFAVDLRRR